MGHFKLQAVLDLDTIREQKELKIEEADYSFVLENKFVQFKYHEDVLPTIIIGPGLFHMANSISGPVLRVAEFVKDSFLDDYSETTEIENIVDSFFNNIPVYKEMGIEVARRNLLFYGPPGTGKSVTIHKCSSKYVQDGKTFCLIWDTNEFDARIVKAFISSFEYSSDVEKVIIVAEDLGGSSNEGMDIRSDSTLLSLLDNADKTFTIPTMIIATTNYPENLAENLANRSGRFDDKIKIDYPNSKSRINLINFYTKNNTPRDALDYIENSTCDTFTAAHIKECYIRSRIRNIPLQTSMIQVYEQIREYERNFTKFKKGMGF